MILLSRSLILSIISMTCNCLGCVVVYLKYVNPGGKSCPKSLQFVSPLCLQKMPWICYRLCGANFCLRSRQKINSYKMESL